MSLHPPNQQRTRRTCMVPGCDRRYEARGYCTLHYERWRRTNEAQGGTAPLARLPQGRQRICLGCKVDDCDEKHFSRGYCSRHYAQQRKRNGGVWDTPPANVQQQWTPERLALLDQMLEDARPRAEMAVALTCSVKAISQAIQQHDIQSERERHLTMPGVAELLGALTCAVRRWVAEGYLRTVGTTSGIFVRRADLVEFLNMPVHWHRWDPDVITDPALQRWTLKVRGHRRFLTVQQAAQVLSRHPQTVLAMVRDEANDYPLRAVMDGRRYMIPAQRVERYRRNRDGGAS